MALRGAVATMFTLTGVSHFVGMRQDMIAMVPPGLPAPGLLVTITGLLELIGAAGLLQQRTAPWAAGGLCLLLMAMFPANAYAAVEGIVVGGSPAMPLVPRALLQETFLAATTAILITALRDRRGPSTTPAGP